MTVTTQTAGRIDFAAARRSMIDSQLRVSGVNDPAVLRAFGSVAREDFVPAAARDHAYIDRALPLGEDGRALAAPLFHGMMLGEAAIRPGERVVVVSDSGYLAALVEALGGVVTLQPVGAVPAQPSDAAVLLVDGAIEQVGEALAAQLSDGGRMVTGLVERGVTRLATGRKVGGTIALLPLAEVGIPVLPEFAAPKRWSFA